MLPCRVYDLLSDNCERLSTFHTAQTPFSSAETSRFPAGAHFKRPTRPMCGEFTSRAEFSLKIHSDTIPANQMGHVRRMHTHAQPHEHTFSQLTVAPANCERTATRLPCHGHNVSASGIRLAPGAFVSLTNQRAAVRPKSARAQYRNSHDHSSSAAYLIREEVHLAVFKRHCQDGVRLPPCGAHMAMIRGDLDIVVVEQRAHDDNLIS